MREKGRKHVNFHSIIIKFLAAFLLFGSILVMVAVSIQNDSAQTASEELATARSMLYMAGLEQNLGSGAWSVCDHTLFKGSTAIGNGTDEKAAREPFASSLTDAVSFVCCMMDASLADEAVINALPIRDTKTALLICVAGVLFDEEDSSPVGTFTYQTTTAWEQDDFFTEETAVNGHPYYCCGKVIRDADGRRIGALVVGSDMSMITAESKKAAQNASLAISVLILYTFFALFLFVAKWNRSLKRMEDYLADIGSGMLPDKPLRISGGDELSEMADVINDMKASLKERERLRNELETARTIQAEMLPDTAAHQLPDACRLTGLMEPAKEVGGDLYDFFMIDADHLGLVIADVSDKGTPAALFMATAKMCIKDNMMLGAEPAEVLFRVNNRLLESNKSGLFVTAWIGTLNLTNGSLTYAMAGHPYPFLKRFGQTQAEHLTSDKNLVLAGLPDFVFLQDETVLRPGDRLFLYTDGLDEARNIEGGFFGQERIRAYLESHGTDDVRSVVSGMKACVDAFAAGREQFDDLTMLMIEYTGGTVHE